MKLRSVALCRFGSFREEVTFDFPDDAGLFFLRGDNREEPMLEANGAGKSTLWNAICWCAFDRTVKGLRAGDVASWDDPKGASVRLCYTDDLDTQIEVRRQHAPNKWELSADGESWIDLVKHDNNPFLADLRLQLEPFLSCILMGQGKPMFLDLSPTKKAELFSDVLNLDVWLERSKRAGDKRDTQDKTTRELERNLSDVEGELRGINHASLDGSASEWKTEREERLHVVESRYARALEDRRALKVKANAAAIAVDTQRRLVSDAFDEEGQAQKYLHEATETARQAENEAKEGERYCNAETDSIQRFRKLADCPTCKQKVPHEHRNDIADGMQAALTKRARAQTNLRADEATAQKARVKAKNHLDDCAVAWADARKRLDDDEADRKRAENDLLYIDKDLDRLEDEAERINAERNPFASLKQEALDREEGLQSRRADLEQQIDDSNAKAYLFNYWVKGFKELRLKLINDSLRELEIEVNSNVTDLGLSGWEIRFDVDKESKSGSITRGFNVTISSPHNNRPVPWESWSGGEGQRLRVAAQQGLADLIRSRTGCTLELEVWDEPTEHLSGQGVRDLLDALAERARLQQRQIWVVDHRALGYGAFTDVYTVVKDSTGSHFEHIS